MKTRCSAEARAACPFQPRDCYSDTHHLGYPRNQYQTKIERQWRELSLNKEQLPRCIHQAIHASGYLPEKPPREQMLSEIWGEDSGRAEAERDKQLFLGQLFLERGDDIA